MGYKLNGVNTGGLPVDYIKRFVDAYDIKIFIETGTAGGQSVREASEIFEVCHSIEVVEGRASGEFPDNVTLHTGKSQDKLKEIASEYKGERICFWLDAHWSEPFESEPGTVECPVLDEIEAIKGHDALILIDDARLFQGFHPWPCDYRRWPRFMDVFIKLHDVFPKHGITLVDDYIIAYPDYMEDTFRVEWWDRFKERFPEDGERVRQSAKFLFREFKKYIE